MELKKRELEAYCGDVSQILGIQECVFQGGKAKGTNAYIVNNGCGIEMTVLKDKGFTISKMVFKGINMGFLSKSGVCAPEFYQEDGTRGFLRTFEAGFLTTCGLTYMGAPCEDDGNKNGLHGVISNTPVEHASSSIEWKDDVAWLTLKGHAREAYLFGPNLEIRREFRLNSKENKLWICDYIENHGFKDEPLMLLYHLNLGYPMLDESCSISTNFDQITPRNEHARDGIEKSGEFLKPTPNYEEKVYFHTMADKKNTQGWAMVENKNLQKSISIKFDPTVLPVLNQWNSPCSGDYSLGIEPGTAHVAGRDLAHKEGTLQYIKAGETKKIELEIKFIDN